MKKEYDIAQGSKGIQRVSASPIRAILDRAVELRSQGKQVIPLSAGEPNFHTPKAIKEAAKRAIDENYTHYGSNRGLLELRKILSGQMKETSGVLYDPESEVFVTSSGAEAINNAIMAFVDEGDEVIIFTPAFVSYKNLVNFCGGVFVDIPLKKENGFQIDPAELEAHITEKTKMIILNNPNNPTGAVYTRKVLEEVAALAVKYNLLVISDEMYSRLTYDGAKFYSICEFPGMKERSLIISGFSKTYAMTGWRLGYIMTDRRLGIPLLRMHQYSTTCSPTFIQKGLADSMLLPETRAEVEEMLASFAKRRRLLLQGLDTLEGITYVKPFGAFYVMADVSALGFTGQEFAQRLLEEAYVATVPAVGLGDSCRDFIRISYAASEEDLREGLKRIRKFLEMQA